MNDVSQLAIATQEAERHAQRLKAIRAGVIREMSREGFSQAALAQAFGISGAAVSLIVKAPQTVPPPNESILVHQTEEE